MTNILTNQRFLAIYSGLLTLAFVATVVCGLCYYRRSTFLTELNVQRINLREPDGTLRLVISSNARFPGAIIQGKEYEHPFRKNTAGLVFFDDEGTENGGLVFGGKKGADGKIQTFGHLSFDQYMQDQVLALTAEDENGERKSQLAVFDRPDYPIVQALEQAPRISKLPPAQQAMEWKQFLESKGMPQTRLTMGRERDRSVALRLKDTEGRNRIVIMVMPDGTPSMQFLDEQGKIVSQLPQLPGR